MAAARRMIARLHATAAAVLVLCMFGATAIVATRLPAARPLVGIPMLATVVWVSFATAPWITPRGRNLLRAQSAYGTIWLAATSLLAAIFCVTVARVLGAHPTPGLLFVAMGAFLIVAGNLCGKLPPNHLAGVRTPWALADDEIWDKTQRLGGWCLVVAGFVIVNAALLLGIRSAAHVVMGSLITVAVIVMTASWNWARLKRRAALENNLGATRFPYRVFYPTPPRSRSEMHQCVSAPRVAPYPTEKYFRDPLVPRARNTISRKSPQVHPDGSGAR